MSSIMYNAILEMKLPQVLKKYGIDIPTKGIEIVGKADDEIEYTWFIDIDNKKYILSYYKETKEIILEERPPSVGAYRKII